MSAAANLLFRVISPLAAADIRPPSHASVLPRVVDLSVAADEVLRVVRLVTAAHLLAVVLDLQVAAAADVALWVVGLRAAARRHPSAFDARLERVAAANPLGSVVRLRRARFAVNSLVLHEIRVWNGREIKKVLHIARALGVCVCA